MRNEEVTKALEGLWEAQAISELISKGDGTIDKVDRATYEAAFRAVSKLILTSVMSLEEELQGDKIMKKLDAMDEITKNLAQAEAILLMVDNNIKETAVSDSLWTVRDLIARTKDAVNVLWEGGNETN